jgi:hypothetical protein
LYLPVVPTWNGDFCLQQFTSLLSAIYYSKTVSFSQRERNLCACRSFTAMFVLYQHLFPSRPAIGSMIIERQRCARRAFFVASAQRIRKVGVGGIHPAWSAIP